MSGKYREMVIKIMMGSLYGTSISNITIILSLSTFWSPQLVLLLLIIWTHFYFEPAYTFCLYFITTITVCMPTGNDRPLTKLLFVPGRICSSLLVNGRHCKDNISEKTILKMINNACKEKTNPRLQLFMLPLCRRLNPNIFMLWQIPTQLYGLFFVYPISII